MGSAFTGAGAGAGVSSPPWVSSKKRALISLVMSDYPLRHDQHLSAGIPIPVLHHIILFEVRGHGQPVPGVLRGSD
jgi:hypothetical protein